MIKGYPGIEPQKDTITVVQSTRLLSKRSIPLLFVVPQRSITACCKYTFVLGYTTLTATSRSTTLLSKRSIPLLVVVPQRSITACKYTFVLGYHFDSYQQINHRAAYLMMTVSSLRSHKQQQVLQPHLPLSTEATAHTAATDKQQ